MHLHQRLFLGLTALTTLLSTAASGAAQESKGFSLDRFDPSVPGSDWFAAESLDLRGKPRFAGGLVLDYARKPLVIYDQKGDEVAPVVGDQLFAHVGAAAMLWDRARFSLSLPVAVYQAGDGAPLGTGTLQSKNATTTGDLRLGVDVRLVGEYRKAFTLAVGGRLYAPTGSQESYTGDGSVRGVFRAMVAGEIAPFVYAASLGVHARPGATLGGDPLGTELPFTVAAGARLLEDRLVVGPELTGATGLSKSDAVFGRTSTPVELLLGGHYLLGDAVQLGAGIGPGLTRAFGTPAFRGLLSLTWIQPVEVPPPPPPPDRDGDGIIDAKDACIDVKGVPSDDPMMNGCPPPPPDRDKDTIVDADDACPDEAGVKTDDPKTNGCPPPKDSDGDGVMDPDDACVEVPGIKTDDPKTNGCPDPDRDKDSIKNDEDACPDTAGPPNEDKKKNGCPAARVEKGQILILEQVQFAYNSDVILKASDTILSAVQKILSENPQIAKVSIEGHTDNKGGAKYNKKLSDRRAASVMKWLVKHGIDKARLSSVGYGPERPISDNSTEEGRANNRRVEFHIVDQSGAAPAAPAGEGAK